MDADLAATEEREPGDDTDAEVAAAANRKRIAADRKNNGRQTVDPRKRQEAIDMLGKVGKFMTDLGIYTQHRTVLDGLITALEEAGR